MANFYAHYSASNNGAGTPQLTVGTIDSQTASNDGAVIASNQLVMQSASATKPGLVNNSAQSMSGAKTFTTSVETPSLLLKGSVSGDLTLTVPSAVTPYSLQWPAAQAGGATFLKNDGSGGLSWASGTGASGVDSVGTINAQTKSADAAVISGTTIYFQTADGSNPGQVSTGAQTFAGTKTFANIIDSGLTASTVPYADASKQLTSSAVTPTELGYVSGVTSAIQTQLNGKQATLTTGNLTDVGTDGITVTGGTGAVIGTGTSIAQRVADSTHNGYLSSNDWNTFNGKGAGTVTSVAATVPSVLSISGSPVTGSGTLAIGYSGTALPIANGGTAVTSVTTAPAATSFAGWDANKNLSANSLINGFASTATGAGTTTLTVASTFQQYFTGSSTQTVVLPVATTLVNGQQFQIVNLSSGVVTVQTSGSNSIQAMAANTSLLLTCINTAGGTGTASWSWEYNQYQSSVLPVNLGGTGVSSATAYAVLCGGTTTTGALQSVAALGASGTVLTSNGAGALPTFQAVAAPALNYTSQTTGYSAVINDWVVCSGASFTVTLPTAASQTGKLIKIQHAGTSLSQVYTLNTTSAQTIGGIASGSYALYTSGEVLIVFSDGSNWQISDHKTETPWTSFTMVITGTTTNPTKVTSPTTDLATWKRIGQDMRVQYLYNGIGGSGGAAGSGTYLFALPTNATIDTNIITLSTDLTLYGKGQIVGRGIASTTTNVSWDIMAFDSTHVYAANTAGGTWSNSQIALGTTAHSTFWYDAPIVGWQP